MHKTTSLLISFLLYMYVFVYMSINVKKITPAEMQLRQETEQRYHCDESRTLDLGPRDYSSFIHKGSHGIGTLHFQG